MRQSLTIALAATLLAAGSAAAQLSPDTAQTLRPDARGWTVGVQLHAGANPNQNALEGFKTVGGAALTLDYAFSDRLSLFTRGSYGYETTQLDVGARYRFGQPGERLRPYVEAGVSGVRTSNLGRGFEISPDTAVDPSARAYGVGILTGIGLEYQLRPNLALDVGLSQTFGRFTRGDVTTPDGVRDDVDVTGDFARPRVNVGLRFSF